MGVMKIQKYRPPTTTWPRYSSSAWPTRNAVEALTPRETEVLALLTTGQTNQQIAQGSRNAGGEAEACQTRSP